MHQHNELRGRQAVITGASSGIGRAIALALAAAGTRLVLCGRDADRLAAVATAAADAGATDTATFAGDLTDPATVDRLATTARRAGGVDVLVHSMGLFAAGRVDATTPAVFDDLLRVNLQAPFALTRALLSALRARRGQVVFINSSAGLGARGGYGAYAASKAALKSLADALREEENQSGLRVLTVYPGRTATPMQEVVVAAEGGTYHPERLLQPEDVAASVVHALTLPPTAELTELMIRPRLKS